jgi:predicted regulator of Ras-like GTPase activity (Roadblock/LC7/MglB family)
MAVGGDLQDMDVSSIIAVNCNQMNQARLQIWHRDSVARVFFEAGNIVHMTLDSLEGEGVISELLSWSEGTFELERGIPAPKRTVTTGWSELVLGGMQRLDERSVPDEESTVGEIGNLDPGKDAPFGGTREPNKRALQEVLEEFGASTTTIVASTVTSMPEGDVLAGYPSIEADHEPASHLARALREAQQAASKMEWGAVDAMTVVTDRFNLHVFVIDDGNAYVAIVAPREVMPAIIRVAFDKFRSRLERAVTCQPSTSGSEQTDAHDRLLQGREEGVGP